MLCDMSTTTTYYSDRIRAGAILDLLIHGALGFNLNQRHSVCSAGSVLREVSLFY